MILCKAMAGLDHSNRYVYCFAMVTELTYDHSFLTIQLLRSWLILRATAEKHTLAISDWSFEIGEAHTIYDF